MKREWLDHNAELCADFIQAHVQRMLAERDAEIADLNRQIKYLEARLAVEKQSAYPKVTAA